MRTAVKSSSLKPLSQLCQGWYIVHHLVLLNVIGLTVAIQTQYTGEAHDLKLSKDLPLLTVRPLHIMCIFIP